jgi:hypothetical protein
MYWLEELLVWEGDRLGRGTRARERETMVLTTAECPPWRERVRMRSGPKGGALYKSGGERERDQSASKKSALMFALSPRRPLSSSRL